MDVNKQDIDTLIEQGKKVSTKVLVHYYKSSIMDGLPYEIIRNRILSDFNIELSYDSIRVAIGRHLNKIENINTNKPIESNQPQSSSLRNKSKEIDTTDLVEKKEEVKTSSELLKPIKGVKTKGF